MVWLLVCVFYVVCVSVCFFGCFDLELGSEFLGVGRVEGVYDLWE